MYAKQEAIQEVIKALKKAVGKGFIANPDDLSTPPEPKLGDIAFPCFELAKRDSKDPKEVATELAAKIGSGKLIEKAKAAGPYINFYLNDKAFSEQVLKEIKKHGAKYGESSTGKGTSVLVDYAQPNTHKEFHVGHIRAAVLGQAVINTLRANEYKVTAASYIGDSGADVAKAIWGLKKFHDGEKFEKEERAKKLGEVYVEATKYAEDHEEAKDEIADVQRKLEAKEDPWHSLWKETRQWSIDYFKGIFAELNVKPDAWYFESEVEEGGKELVKKALTDGVAKKSEGATIIDLENVDLGAFLILKSDGSALYSTMDLGLAALKEKQHKPDRQVFVVDVRQSFYFQQLFAALKQMGFTKQFTHIAFDMVTLPEGAMASRAGNVVTYIQLRDEMIKKLEKETKKRHKDWQEKKIKETAFKIAIASINFMMLRQDPKSVITFDIKEAMSFDGFTGPYILYTIARIESIKRKSKIKPKIDSSKLTHDLEQSLIRSLGEYPILIQDVGASYQISAIANWAFDLSKMFAEYYHEVRVIDEKDKETTAARLQLCSAISEALTGAMQLLGIEMLQEM